MATIRTNDSCYSRHQFEQELLKVWPALRAYAHGLTKSVQDGDDLCQQTVSQALERWENFVPETKSSMRAWTFTILRNRFLTNLRAARFREGAWTEELTARSLATDGNTPAAERVVDFKCLLRCIASLDDNQRDVIIAIGYLGLTYDDAAYRLGCETGTVRSRTSRARVKLAQRFEEGVEVSEEAVEKFRTASQGISPDDPYFIIAEACETLCTTYLNDE